jgi:glycosyltransferase involved in cell wall biosynthesis
LTDNTAKGVLGLFSEQGLHGGIQTSGRVAWQGMLNNGIRPCFYFCYGEPEKETIASPATHLPQAQGLTQSGSREQLITGSANENGSCFVTNTRTEAIKLALSQKWPVQLAFVWHLRLLKLLPFFRLPSPKVVLFLHGIEAWRTQRWLDQKALKSVSLFLSNSDFTWQRFLQFNPAFTAYPQQTIHLGIGQSLIDETPVCADFPAALMISRLERNEDYKGHREMIRAWPAVLQRLPEAELWIVGAGNLTTELEILARECGVAERVKLFGWVSEERKQELLGRCRCLALPSRAEGFGLVYLEAMRVGRPCLVSTFDAGREVVNPPEAGLAVDTTNQLELIEALCKLLTPGAQWDDWSANARRRYDRLFTAAQFQARLAAALFA